MQRQGNAYGTQIEVKPTLGCALDACLEACVVNVCGIHGCIGDACFINA